MKHWKTNICGIMGPGGHVRILKCADCRRFSADCWTVRNRTEYVAYVKAIGCHWE
jgi:hypothetical protein